VRTARIVDRQALHDSTSKAAQERRRFERIQAISIECAIKSSFVYYLWFLKFYSRESNTTTSVVFAYKLLTHPWSFKSVEEDFAKLHPKIPTGSPASAQQFDCQPYCEEFVRNESLPVRESTWYLDPTFITKSARVLCREWDRLRSGRPILELKPIR